MILGVHKALLAALHHTTWLTCFWAGTDNFILLSQRFQEAVLGWLRSCKCCPWGLSVTLLVTLEVQCVCGVVR